MKDEDRLIALKEEPLEIARREYEVLRRLEVLQLPAVLPLGLAELPGGDNAILVTEFLGHSLQYRRLLMRLPPGPSGGRERLLDAMASLLVDLHRGGVYWGDCSLANTLFRRDGDLIQAYLVDAETSETHDELSDGQREYDLEVLVENVAFGLADLAAFARRADPTPEDYDEAIREAESVQSRYRALWDELHTEEELAPGDRYAVESRIRRLNDLGFAIDEIELEPGRQGRLRFRVAVTTRRFHARELERRTGLVALEGQARILMNDLRQYRSWLEWFEVRPVDRPEGARRWLAEVYRPTIARLAAVVGPERDIIQSYCDVLEHKWLLSEQAGRDVGLEAAIRSYLEIGAPAPEAGPDLAAELATEPPSDRARRSALSPLHGCHAKLPPMTMIDSSKPAHEPGRFDGACRPGGRCPQALRRRAGRRRGLLRGPAGRGVRAARPERCGQDNDRRDARRPAGARLRRAGGPGHRRRPQPRRAQAAGRGHPPDRRALSEAHGRRGPRPVPELLQALPADRPADRVPRPRRAARPPRPGSSPAASASGWPWPWRWSTIPR